MDYFIDNLLPIIVLVVSLTVGTYVSILLFKQYKDRKLTFIQSFFYHQVLLLIFGVYGLVGSALMSNFLLKYYVNIDIIKKAIEILFYMSYPFLIASVFMLMKAGLELLKVQIRTFWIILYFLFMVVGSFSLALVIDDLLTNYDYQFFVSSKYLLFLFFEIVIIAFIGLLLFISFLKRQLSSYIKAVFVYYFIYHTVISIIFLLSNHFDVARIYFLLFYFTGNIFIVYLIPKMEFSDDEEKKDGFDDIYLKYGITNREREIIAEICKGKTNQEIADALFISLQTVKDHIHNIFRKVEVKNRIQLRNIFSVSNEL